MPLNFPPAVYMPRKQDGCVVPGTTTIQFLFPKNTDIEEVELINYRREFARLRARVAGRSWR